MQLSNTSSIFPFTPHISLFLYVSFNEIKLEMQSSIIEQLNYNPFDRVKKKKELQSFWICFFSLGGPETTSCFSIIVATRWCSFDFSIKNGGGSDQQSDIINFKI